MEHPPKVWSVPPVTPCILYMYTTLTTKHQRFWLFEQKEGKITWSIQNYKNITVNK